MRGNEESMSVYCLLVRAGERARHECGLSVRALSALTWTSEDRAAWDDAYWASICIAAARTARCTGYVHENGSLQHDGDTCPIHERYGDERDARYSVHVDCMDGAS